MHIRTRNYKIDICRALGLDKRDSKWLYVYLYMHMDRTVFTSTTHPYTLYGVYSAIMICHPAQNGTTEINAGVTGGMAFSNFACRKCRTCRGLDVSQCVPPDARSLFGSSRPRDGNFVIWNNAIMIVIGRKWPMRRTHY